MSNIRFVLCLHNHQPIGNFDHVFEEAYQDSYLPFLDVFEPYSNLKLALHTSGPLMEWLDENHPEYLDRLAALVAAGRVEIVGGAFYEPILAMLPSRDRVGQITSFREWLESRLGGRVQGMWMPERVWEQSMTRDLAVAGVEYTLLDDFHFKNAGLKTEELHGYFVTEDDGRTLKVFPGSEQLRYLIPFHDAQETIDYLGGIAESHPGAVVVFGDDGEKFGTWPDTKKHVYDNGWLKNFFDLLDSNRDWLQMITLAEATQQVAPLGKVYVPEGSYREMTEWALPAERIVEFDSLHHDLQDKGEWEHVKQFVRGGFWRNFKRKYPESDEMYSRMMAVSRRLEDEVAAGNDHEMIDHARIALYKAQCNCSYWHGAFGGIYLPHLRNAVYNQMIAADNLLDIATGKTGPWVEGTAADYNFDGLSEVRLAGDKLAALVAPARGGMLYELDVRSICHNALATLARRPEAYHQKVLAGPSSGTGGAASIHDRVVFKQEGLDELLQYDSYLRKGLQDHFFDNEIDVDVVAKNQATERGDFLGRGYEAKLRRGNDKVQVQMIRSGNAWGIPLKITKGITLAAGSSVLEIAYLIEGLPKDRPLHFAVEFNFSGMPAGCDDRFFYDSNRNQLGHLGERLDLADIDGLGLIDEWLGLDIGLSSARPTNLWTFPIQSVSQSEGGFEAVHQSVCVMPHWLVQGDAEGRWSVTMALSIDTSLAERRMQEAAVAEASPVAT